MEPVKMSLKEAKRTLGVPIPYLEIQISLRSKVVRIVLVNHERKSGSVDLPLDTWQGLTEGPRTVANLGADG